VKALRRATVALVDDLVHPGVLRYLRRSARIVHVGKRGGCASTPQAFIHRLMVAEAQRGEQVVRIKGGDPFVFGRGGEEADALRAAGIAVQVVNGITAGMAGPAAIGVPVTDRRHTPAWPWSPATPGRRPRPRLAGAGALRADAGGLHGRGTRGRHRRRPARGGLPGNTPVAVVSAAHTAAQRQAVCTLADLVATVQQQQLASPALLVVGDVVRLACGTIHITQSGSLVAQAG
jgi:uroporphyrin-III C-methyltransferase